MHVLNLIEEKEMILLRPLNNMSMEMHTYIGMMMEFAILAIEKSFSVTIMHKASGIVSLYKVK